MHRPSERTIPENLNHPRGHPRLRNFNALTYLFATSARHYRGVQSPPISGRCRRDRRPSSTREGRDLTCASALKWCAFAYRCTPIDVRRVRRSSVPSVHRGGRALMGERVPTAGVLMGERVLTAGALTYWQALTGGEWSDGRRTAGALTD